jgi:hypothetical protein
MKLSLLAAAVVGVAIGLPAAASAEMSVQVSFGTLMGEPYVERVRYAPPPPPCPIVVTREIHHPGYGHGRGRGWGHYKHHRPVVVKKVVEVRRYASRDRYYDGRRDGRWDRNDGRRDRRNGW